MNKFILNSFVTVFVAVLPFTFCAPYIHVPPVPQPINLPNPGYPNFPFIYIGIPNYGMTNGEIISPPHGSFGPPSNVALDDHYYAYDYDYPDSVEETKENFSKKIPINFPKDYPNYDVVGEDSALEATAVTTTTTTTTEPTTTSTTTASYSNPLALGK